MSRERGKRESRRVMAEDRKDVEFYAATDGLVGRPEGFYLDMKERHDAEDVRAKMEGRAPNHEDEGSLPAAVGTQLRVPNDRPDNRWYSNPAIQAMEDKDVDPVTVLPVDQGTADVDYDLGHAAQVARERTAQDEALLNDSRAEQGNEAQASDGTNAESGESTDALENAGITTRDTTV